MGRKCWSKGENGVDVTCAQLYPQLVDKAVHKRLVRSQLVLQLLQALDTARVDVPDGVVSRQGQL
ncbi:hypothetical protein J2S03_000530 [Alicyclobacillus cycloheptanicus]|uniref:Uncharacterized protein n=1 Tax=Alicyclobacillus cycloheptanicus TaxID=1457 RepID=A0ABT9XFW4_9BACL|nr:hypothetical protein [Alicyclobacillus cycloheptanicus]